MANKLKKSQSPKSLTKHKKPKSHTKTQKPLFSQKGGSSPSYYQPNSFDNTPSHGDTSTQLGGDIQLFTSSNVLLFVIVVLLVVISYLLYMNFIAKHNRNNKLLEHDINTALLNEANNIKQYKQKLNTSVNNKLNTNLHNNTNKHINKNTHENFNDDSNSDSVAHPQYNLGHRLVGPDADNMQSHSLFIPVLNHNMERIINPLLPHERSYVNTYGVPTNIPSRGFSGGFQQIGSLNKTDIANDDSMPGNNNKSVILPLYGQPTYPGGNKWNYYTTTDKHAMVKMTFKVGNKESDDRHGVNELMSGDKVQIPEYNGNFDVKIYQFDQPRYIPFVY